MCDRIACWGYVVLVPHLFYRVGRAAEPAPDAVLREARGPEAFFEPGDGAGGALTAEMSGPISRRTSRRCATCPGWARPGRRHRLLHGRPARGSGRAAHPGVAAAGGFHGGGLVTDAADSPHLGLPRRQSRVRLRSRRPGPVDAARGCRRARAALAAAGLTATNEVYAGAGARLLDGRHLDVRRGRHRAPLPELGALFTGSSDEPDL